MINMAIHNKGSKLICKCKDKKCFTSILSLFFVLSFFIISTPSHAFKINSSAIVKGGAIYAVNMNGDFYGQDEYSPLIFSNNKVSDSGGAIFFLSGFENFIPSSSMKVSFAGVVEVENNVASKSGGAMSFYTSTADALMEVNFNKNSYFTYFNNRSLSGGAMYFYADGGDMLTVNFAGDIALTSNSASSWSYGGAMYFGAVGGGKLTANFVNTIKAESNTGGYGGMMGFYANETDSLVEVNFKEESVVTATKNAVSQYGGAMYFMNNALMNVNFSSEMVLLENSASVYGGAIYFSANSSGVLMAINFESTSKITATNNTAGERGGAMFFYLYAYYGTDLDIVMTVNFKGEMDFIGNKTTETVDDGGGGAMRFNFYGGRAKINFDGAIMFSGNKALGSTDHSGGGAICFSANGGAKMEIDFNSGSSINLLSNSTAGAGGGMYFNAFAITKTIINFIKGSNIIASNNTAEMWGGAIAFSETSSSASMINFAGNMVLTDNQSLGSKVAYGGGAISFYYSALGGDAFVNFVNGSSITATNNSANNGGAFYFDAVTAYSIEITFEEGSDVDLSSNTADGDGGGMYLEGDITLINFNGDLALTNNTSGESGGGLCFMLEHAASKSIVINFNADSNIILTNNTSGEYGGGIYFYTDSSYTMNVNFSGKVIASENSATKYGGALHFSKNLVNFNSSSHIIANNNTTSWGGGALSFWDNELVNFNGVVEMSGNVVEGGFVIYNNYGGAAVIFSYCDEINFYGTMILTGNTAYRNGGAMSINVNNMKGRVNFFGTTIITGNSTTDSGGGLVIEADSRSDMVVLFSKDSNTIISDNKAGGRGGGIYAPAIMNLIFEGYLEMKNNSAFSSCAMHVANFDMRVAFNGVFDFFNNCGSNAMKTNNSGLYCSINNSEYTNDNCDNVASAVDMK